MHHLKSALALAILGAALTAPAYAGPTTASINNCQSAIAERLGLASPATYQVTDVHTSMQYRDFTFSVATGNGVDAVEVTCRARKNASVRSITIDEAAVPVSVATK